MNEQNKTSKGENADESSSAIRVPEFIRTFLQNIQKLTGAKTEARAIGYMLPWVQLGRKLAEDGYDVTFRKVDGQEVTVTNERILDLLHMKGQNAPSNTPDHHVEGSK